MPYICSPLEVSIVPTTMIKALRITITHVICSELD